MACIRMFVMLSDPVYQAQPVGERIQSIVSAFFRIFDSNGNGIIEVFEVNEILSDVVSGIATIISSLVNHFEPYLLKVHFQNLFVESLIYSRVGQIAPAVLP
jgi:hypothetical protein